MPPGVRPTRSVRARAAPLPVPDCPRCPGRTSPPGPQPRRGPCSDRRERRPSSLAREAGRPGYYRCSPRRRLRGLVGSYGLHHPEQATERLPKAVPLALLGGLLEGDGGLMQELVQQRLTELFDTRAVLR